MRSRSTRLGVVALAALLLGALQPAAAVNADHGNRVVTDDPANNTPHVMDGSVDAITQLGDKVIAAGSFSKVSPSGSFANTADDVVRHGIFAFDADTGAIDPAFDPDLGGTARSLDTDGTYIYVGGRFGSVGGDSSIKRVAKLTASGEAVDGFRAVPNSRVNEVVVRRGRLYIGGPFTKVTSRSKTSTRRALAALSRWNGKVLGGVNVPFTGVYDPNNANGGGRTSIVRFDVTADGSRLVAIGNFARVGGQRHAQLAVLDTRPGRRTSVARWWTNRFDRSRNSCRNAFDTITRDVDFSPNGSYFVVTTSAGFGGGLRSGTLCDTASRWETRRGGNPTWVDYTGGDTLYGVAVAGGVVYIGGHMRWLNNPFQADQAGPGAVSRRGIAALDPVNGLPLTWNPGRALGVGAQALLTTDQGLWVGSDTTELGGETHGRLAFLPLAGGSTVPRVRRATLPNYLLLFQRRGQGAALVGRALNGNGVPASRPRTANTSVDWSRLRGSFLVDDVLYYGFADGRFYKRTFDARTGDVGPASVVGLRNDPQDGQRIPFPVARLTGMFFDAFSHRLYYTVRGNRRLFYRYFSPESDVVGAQTLRTGSSVNLSRVSGMTFASGRVLYGSWDSKALKSVGFHVDRIVGRPKWRSADGTWKYRGMATPNG